MATRETMAAVAAATTAIVGLAGCSSDTSKTEDIKPTPTANIGGQEQQLGDTVNCADREGSLVISMGDPDAGVIATLSSADDSPEVYSVVFGDVDGRQFVYIKDSPAPGTTSNADVVKDGKLYTITGTVNELRDIEKPETRPFEIEVTCD